MAAAGAPVRVPVAVALRVLGLSRQGYYQWLKDPVSQRDWDDAHLIDVLYDLHADDVTLGYRFLTDELESEHGISASENRVHRLCRIAGIHASHHRKRSKPGSTGPAPHDDLLAVVDEHGVIRHDEAPTGRTRSGSGTSRNTRPEKASSTSARSKTSGRTRSSVTPSTPA